MNLRGQFKGTSCEFKGTISDLFCRLFLRRRQFRLVFIALKKREQNIEYSERKF